LEAVVEGAGVLASLSLIECGTGACF
jgi:hypothetical protein